MNFGRLANPELPLFKMEKEGGKLFLIKRDKSGLTRDVRPQFNISLYI